MHKNQLKRTIADITKDNTYQNDLFMRQETHFTMYPISLPVRATNCRKKSCGHTNQLRLKKKLK